MRQEPISRVPFSSPMVSANGGYAIYDDLLNRKDFRDLCSEAHDYYRFASYDVYFGPPKGRNRHAHPPRKFRHTNGGPVQERLFNDGWLLDFLSDECQLFVHPPSSGTFSYYLETDDFIGLHLDREKCDLVIITVLHDNSDPRELSGSLVIYPDHTGDDLRDVSAASTKGRAIKPRAGQSILLFGGVVPHYLEPTAQGQDRVISVCCFQVSA
jgi:hypothetical protein